MSDRNRPLSYQDQPIEPSVLHNDNDTLLVTPRKDDIPTISPLYATSQPDMTSDFVQIALYLPDQFTPIMVSDPDFVLGRVTSNDRANIVDLSPYRGYLLGVSRHHVSITQTPEGCLIKDLGSANGTWLNGARLSAFVPYVLKDGDHLELGHLSLTIRFVVSGSMTS